ncbi:Exocyst complex component EXO70B1 [Sesamum alatum]|uniref:Exocyst subunit Exo70 family protein n=1 Tax=Sesamum alatum TaxID=300844 RepID=A0AAE1Y9M1_9LAMI|nr:Exocyst complex component EXO70B1 [Sesamum alatum]
MDPEKDIPLPQTSSPTSASASASASVPHHPTTTDPDNKDDDHNTTTTTDNKDHPNNNNDSNELHPEKSDQEDLPQQNLGLDTPSTTKQEAEAEAEAEADPDPEKADDALDSDIKEQEQPPADHVNLQEPPPPLSLDLNKVSEEVDQYISTILSSTSKGDESTPPEVPTFVHQFALLIEAKIVDYECDENPMKWSQLEDQDSTSFLEATLRLSSLSKAISELSTEHKHAHFVNRIGGVLQRAMSYIEEEFKSLVEDYKIHDSDHSNKQSTSSTQNQESDENPPPPPESAPLPLEDNNFPGYSEDILSDLIRLSKVMIAGGYEMECCQVYFVARRNAMEESLQKFGFEKHSMDDVQKMPWESLEREIVNWIRTFKQCASVHFSSERRLSQVIFSDHPLMSESLFCSLSQGVILQLLNFADAVALTKRAAEKLFKFLDIYEAMRDILPIIDNLFLEESMNEVKREASMIKGRIGEAMISIFVDLENSIKADLGKTPVPGGAVHPLTRYTMNYLKYVCEYKETLEHVFKEHQKIERADSATGSDFNYQSQAQNPNNNNNNNNEVVKQSPFQTQIIKVMDLLDANIESKSKLYKDHSLSSIFMMNNGRYILQKVRSGNEINRLMGDSWCRKRSSDLRQYHKGYTRETWGKLLSCFQPDGLMHNGKVVKPVLKERFKSFNAMFDEIHKTQSTWVISDEQLQSEMRVSISNMVIPAYRSFLGRYSQTFTPGRQTEKYVKYQPEDIETYIDELFDGNAALMGKRRP